jgi:hypothetical protein
MRVSDIPKDVLDWGFDGTDKTMPSNWVEPSAYMQLKGTDICMDFHCDCGASCHFDGYFAYVVKCPHCATLWKMPFMLYPVKATKENEQNYWIENPKILSPDEDWTNDEGEAMPVGAA